VSQAQEAPDPRRWTILMAVMLSAIMGPVDGSVVNVALPTLSAAFHAGLNTVGWVSMAYLLVLGTLILTYGRLGDMFGFRRVLLAGIGIFTVASAACALAPTIWVLIAFRALQAVGAGMFMAVGPAIITAAFPAYERGRALGINAMSIAAGLALGPALGGFLLTVSTWHAIFLINVPIGIASFIWCHKVVPRTEHLTRQKFDVAGAVLGFVALGSLLLVGSYGQEWGWASHLTTGLFAVVVLGTCAFVWWERRAPQPMLDLSLFHNRVFSAANAAALLNFTAQNAMVFLMPFYLQQVLNYTPSQVGLVMTVTAVATLLVAPVAGALSDRLGTRWLAFSGQVAVTLALLLMTGLGPASRPVGIAWRLGLFGVGLALFQSPNNSAVMGSVPRHRLGVGSGVLATVRNVGMVTGIAVSTAVFTWQYSARLKVPGAMPTVGAFMGGLRAAYVAAAILAGVGAVASLVRDDALPAAAK